jgi:hypothetical protein
VAPASKAVVMTSGRVMKRRIMAKDAGQREAPGVSE